MDGYELTATLKGQPGLAGIPIVMLTSRAGDKHRQRAFELGAADYVVKPYQEEALLAALSRAVAKSRRPAEPQGAPS
jgi:chemosensory pili system protein ChpA (sensor histidine kinase/response regulator)